MATYSKGLVVSGPAPIGVVGAGQYVIVTYIISSVGAGSANLAPSIVAHFGPGQTVPATYSVTLGAGGTNTAVYSFSSGVTLQS